ncbi:MAG TPA: hypothetical protein VGH42_09490 [Verrucomicrobiae bacterium]|jgi:hypothetical protein
MNDQEHSKKYVRAARTCFALLAGLFLIPGLRAQPAELAVDNRLLLVFDTSVDMKKRLPTVQIGLDEALATSMGGDLQPGDSIGVWTFDQELHAGQFPLQSWVPENGAVMASNIIAFVGKQHYAKGASFDALQAPLDRIMRDSERLTVLIFCDGETQMNGTPFDSGINEIFQKRQAGQKKARHPFVILLRAQLGEYVGCTVNFPPLPMSFPAFPPLPPPPAPPAPKQDDTPPEPAATLPPLIIVGTHVGTNFPPPEPAPETNAAPLVQTNEVSEPTNSVAALPGNSDLTSKGSLAIGAIFLLAAAGLTIFMLRRSRKTGPASLITRSMKKD